MDTSLKRARGRGLRSNHQTLNGEVWPVTDDEFLKPASSPGHNEARFMLHKIVFSDSALSVRSEEPEERAEINMSHLEPQVSIQK